MEERQGVRKVTDAELLRVTLEVVTLERLLTLFGWVMLWSVQGQDLRELRRKLEQAGMHRSNAYRALKDIRRIGDRWREAEALPPATGDQVRDTWAVVERLRSLSL